MFVPLQTALTDADRTYLWLRRNRGVCAQIAREYEVSREFVRRVLYGLPSGRSADLEVEKALVQAGAPFVADRIKSYAEAR